ncbi:Retrovirus-related Pol poly from transposon, partial [Paramuricea clavata]
MSSNKAASWKRCPIGELARKRKLLRDSYLQADVKRVELVNELDCVHHDIDKMSKRIDRHKEKLADLCLNEQALSEKRRRLEPKTFAGFSKRKETIRQMTPSTLCPDNSEKLCSDIPVRSAQRRRKETLDASKIIHGNSEAALDGLWVTLANECFEQQLHSYVEASPKMQKIIPMVVKTQTKRAMITWVALGADGMQRYAKKLSHSTIPRDATAYYSRVFINNTNSLDHRALIVCREGRQSMFVSRNLLNTQQKLPDYKYSMKSAVFCNNIALDYYSNFIEVDRLYSKTSTEVIQKLKAHMARCGVPERVVSDNGPQYSFSEFQDFAAQYEFEHVTTSPRYPQSNGKAESVVKTAKRIMMKALDAKADPYLAMLEHRNTPSEGMSTSPAQRLFGRRTRSTILTSRKLLEPTCMHSTKQELQQAKTKQAYYYNKGSKKLPTLKVGDAVRMMPEKGKKSWRKGKVKAIVSPRSYIVATDDGGNYRRNRRHLRKTVERDESTTGVAKRNRDALRLFNNSVTLSMSSWHPAKAPGCTPNDCISLVSCQVREHEMRIYKQGSNHSGEKNICKLNCQLKQLSLRPIRQKPRRLTPIHASGYRKEYIWIFKLCKITSKRYLHHPIHSRARNREMMEGFSVLARPPADNGLHELFEILVLQVQTCKYMCRCIYHGISFLPPEELSLINSLTHFSTSAMHCKPCGVMTITFWFLPLFVL